MPLYALMMEQTNCDIFNVTGGSSLMSSRNPWPIMDATRISVRKSVGANQQTVICLEVSKKKTREKNN